MCVVHISLKVPTTQGLPRSTQIDAVLILYAATLPETVGMLCCIALVVVAVQQHQRQLVGDLAVGCMYQCHSTFLVQRRLATECPTVVIPSVVQTHVQEVVTLGGIGAIECILLGLQWSVVVGIDRIGIDVQRTLFPPDARTQVSLLGVVFLLQLGVRW